MLIDDASISFEFYHLHLTLFISTFLIDQCQSFEMFAFPLQIFIADCQWYKRFIHFIVRKKGPRNKFKKIEMKLQVTSIAELQRHFEC